MIEDILNKPYIVTKEQGKRYVCWTFCKEVYSQLGMSLENFFHDRQLHRIPEPSINCIVLFRIGNRWHSGVVWPDGLHFIHASTKNIFDPNETDYIVCKDRLTGWPYKFLIEGYYVP